MANRIRRAIRQAPAKIRRQLGWQYKMWYYTRAQAAKVAAQLRKGGKKTTICRSKNYNYPEAGGKYIWAVWYK